MGSCTSGGKRAGAGAGASASKNSEPIVIGNMTKSQVESSVMLLQKKVKTNVPLTGTDADIAIATAERKSIAQELKQYTSSRTSDGNPMSIQIFNDYLGDTKSEIADVCISNAKKMSFGNSSLEVGKIAQEIKTQNDVINRLNRLDNIFANHTNAKDWIGKYNHYYVSMMKSYIDGKRNDIGW